MMHFQSSSRNVSNGRWDPHGNLYVVDRTGQAVHYFSPSGTLLHTLSIEYCDPGRTFTPFWVSTHGEQIFVVNGGPWGYLFDRTGKCLGTVSDEYYPLRLQTGFGDRILGVRIIADPNIPIVVTSANLMGETLTTWPLPLGEYPIANRRVQTGGVAVTKSAIYYAVASEPVIHRVELEGSVSSIDLDGHFDHRRPTQDLPPGRAGPDFFKTIERVRFATSNQGLFNVSEDLLLAQYRTGIDRWDRLWLRAEDGSVVSAETDTIGFLYVTDCLAYRVNQPPTIDA